MVNEHSTTTRINQECLIKIYKKFKSNPKKKFIPSEFVHYGLSLKMVILYLRTLFRMDLIEKTTCGKTPNRAWKYKKQNEKRR